MALVESEEARREREAKQKELVDVPITFDDDYQQVQEDRRKRARLESKKPQVTKPVPDRSFKPRFQA